jgi:hypothetical protein
LDVEGLDTAEAAVRGLHYWCALTLESKVIQTRNS